MVLTRRQLHQIDVSVGRNLLLEALVLRRSVDLLFDTTVEHVVLSADPVERVARPRLRLDLTLLSELLPFNFRRLKKARKMVKKSVELLLSSFRRRRAAEWHSLAPQALCSVAAAHLPF